MLCLWPAVVWANARTWTDQEGRSFAGVMLDFTPMMVTIERTSDKRSFSFERSKLSEADNAYLDQLALQARMEEFLKDVPTTYRDADRLSQRKRRPVYIIYRNQEDEAAFDARVDRLVNTPELRELLAGRVVLAVVSERDAEFEAELGDWVGQWPQACMVVIYRGDEKALFNFDDFDKMRGKTEMEFFLAQVREQLEDVERFYGL